MGSGARYTIVLQIRAIGLADVYPVNLSYCHRTAVLLHFILCTNLRNP